MVGAAQEPGTAPGAVQVSGTPPGAPTGVAPGGVPGTEPEVAAGNPLQAQGLRSLG